MLVRIKIITTMIVVINIPHVRVSDVLVVVQFCGATVSLLCETPVFVAVGGRGCSAALFLTAISSTTATAASYSTSDLASTLASTSSVKSCGDLALEGG